MTSNGNGAGMSRHDDVLKGLGLHGQALVATMQMLQQSREHRPSLSQVSKMVGVPAADLRRIFKDDQGLLVAIAEQGLIRLIDATTKAIVKMDQDDPIGQYMALGDAYLDWADNNREQFRLITNSAVLDTVRTPQTRRYLDLLNELMIRILERAKTACCATKTTSPRSSSAAVSLRMVWPAMSSIPGWEICSPVRSSLPRPKRC